MKKTKIILTKRNLLNRNSKYDSYGTGNSKLGKLNLLKNNYITWQNKLRTRR